MRGITHRELFGPQLLAHIGKDLRIRWLRRDIAQFAGIAHRIEYLVIGLFALRRLGPFLATIIIIKIDQLITLRTNSVVSPHIMEAVPSRVPAYSLTEKPVMGTIECCGRQPAWLFRQRWTSRPAQRRRMEICEHSNGIDLWIGHGYAARRLTQPRYCCRNPHH